MKKIILVMSLLVMFCAYSGGCSRGIKESYYALKGSSGKVTLLQGSEDELGKLAYEYGGVQVGPFTNDVGSVTPAEFVSNLPGAIREQLTYRPRSTKEKLKFKKKEETGPFFTGPADKVLLIKGRIIQYESTKNDKKGIVSKAVGSTDEAICRVQVIDQGSGVLLAEGNCIGRVKSSVRTGPKELATGVGKAIRDWLKPEKRN